MEIRKSMFRKDIDVCDYASMQVYNKASKWRTTRQILDTHGNCECATRERHPHIGSCPLYWFIWYDIAIIPTASLGSLVVIIFHL